MRTALFWFVFPALVIACIIFAYIGAREEEKKARYESGITPAR